MSKTKNENRAKEYGCTMAKALYDMFIDDKYRGPNFSWEKFPILASRLAEAQFFTSCKNNVKDLSNLEKICAEACYQEAKRILEQSEYERSIKYLTM